ncbi:collagenase [Kitasatospora azatica]|uniref:collagenase n=1 Tax=Kitasatospora azatica TaxID=58347 RepID=UPI00055FBCF9|nr:collagenase [Kitasatospora azatica]
MRALPVGKHLPRLLIATLALTVGLGLAAPQGQAHAAPAAVHAGASASTGAARPGLPPRPGTGSATVSEDQRASASAAKDRPPLSATPKDPRKPAAAAQLGRTAAASCSTGAFTGATGSALVRAIKSAGVDCVNSLFNLTGNDAHLAFQESQMTTVAYALRDAAPSYPGDDSTQVEELVLYLRAGYFVQWYHSGDVGSYGTALQTAIRSGLDGFYAAPHSQDVSEANGAVLAEAVTLIDSAGENARYLYVVKRLLNGYDPSRYNGSYSMLLAVNNTYTVLFRGHQNADFVAATEADPSVIDTLDSFAGAHLALLGTDQGYLESNAGTELARFLQDTNLLGTVRPLAKGLLDRSSISGTTAPLWVGIAQQTDAYDQANCAYYGTCDLANRLRAAVLTINYTCSPSIRIVAQALTSDQLTAACASLRSQDAFFHGLVKDSGPVANDNNTTIEVDVFHSNADYQTYAGTIFGMSTDNGGIYLEGDPAAPGNQPRFVAYQIPGDGFAADIWNLNHEYTHYLDGRFDTLGDFTAATSTADTIWWIEGLAEYVSYTYRGVTDTEAVADAARGSYPLSTIFANTYDSGQDRVYPWGYLSVRYMLEKHRADVDTLLGDYRSGNYTAALNLLTGIGTRYDADWANWLAACGAGACNAGSQPPTASFTALATDLTVSFTDTSTGAASRSWDFGDGTASTAANPVKTYPAAGSYTVRLTVTNSQGVSATSSQTVTVTGASECTAADKRQLGQNCRRSNLSATAGNYSYLYLSVPAGTKSLTITSTGSADLYYNPTGWATSSAHTAAATGAGPHTLTISNPQPGWNYISLYNATSPFTGASVTTRF